MASWCSVSGIVELSQKIIADPGAINRIE